MRILLLFIDGIGIGKNDPQCNPLARFHSKYLSIFSDAPLPVLPYQGVVVPTRVDMGVEGLPQSATGQTALFTGRNAAQELGRHLSGFPTPTLRKILDESSLFKSLQRLGKEGLFANALSHQYFKQPKNRISATTRALQAGRFPWLDMNALREGRAISHDLTNEFLSKRGYDAPLRAPQESSRILVEISQQTDFTLFEFLLTDLVGHSRDFSQAESVVQRLDTLLEVVLSLSDLNETTIVLTSDHGNFEDLCVKTHTHNRVPTCIWGAGKDDLLKEEFRIEEIAPALISLLNK